MLINIRNYFMLFLSLSLVVPLYSFSGGTGSSASPFEVNDCYDLDNISNYLSSNFTQMSNVDCSVYSSGAGFDPIGDFSNGFKGMYNGNNYKISNLFMDTATNDAGLFSFVLNGSIINLILENSIIIGQNDFGTVVGTFNGFEFSNISVINGSVESIGSDVGGLIGDLIKSNDMYNLSFTGKVNATGSKVGGLIGDNTASSSLINSFAIAEVTSSSFGVGGLVGDSDANITLNSYFIGNVTGTNSVGGLIGYGYIVVNESYSIATVKGSSKVGGLIGTSYEEIYNSYSISNVTGTSNVGGLIGYAHENVTNSYSIGTVFNSGSRTGGLLGTTYGAVINSYSLSNVTGINYVGGLVGYASSNDYISSSYAKGDVFGVGGVGGLVGYTFQDIINSYATGDVNATTMVGGLVGENHATVRDSFAIGDVSGNLNYTGGLFGYGGYLVYNSFSTGNVSGIGTVGGFTGVLDAGGINSYWYNNSNNPSNHIASGNNSGITAVNNENYFYSLSNEPMNSWDNSNWIYSGSNYPTINPNPVSSSPASNSLTSLSSLPSVGFWSAMVSVVAVIGFLLF